MLENLPPIRTAAEYQEQAGLTPGEFRSQLARGLIQTVRRGYFVPTAPRTPEEAHACLVIAESRALTTAAASHVSAGLLLGLPVPRAALERAWFTVPPSTHGRRGPRVVKVSAALDAAEIVVRGGVRMTAAARTVADIARSQPLEWGVAAADAALHLKLATPDDLGRAAAIAALRGARRARAAVAFADARAESPLESISRVQLRRAGVPDPVPQLPIRLDGRVVAYGDFGWPEFGVIGECDGRVKYGDLLRPGETAADAVMAEKRRENLIAQAGWWIVRWDLRLALNADALGRRVRDAFDFGRPQRVAAF